MKKKHKSNIKSLWWYPDNKKFISGGLDGYVYEWSILDDKQQKPLTKIYNSQGPKINSVLATKDGTVYCSTANNNVVMIKATGDNGIKRKFEKN